MVEDIQETDGFRGSGKIERRGHCESHRDTEAAMEYNGREKKSNEESDRVETRL